MKKMITCGLSLLFLVLFIAMPLQADEEEEYGIGNLEASEANMPPP